jgi:hypothetical protein
VVVDRPELRVALAHLLEVVVKQFPVQVHGEELLEFASLLRKVCFNSATLTAHVSICMMKKKSSNWISMWCGVGCGVVWCVVWGVSWLGVLPRRDVRRP